MISAGPIVVAIPVKNEESFISACLDALSRQTRCADIILLLLNNCSDQTLAICKNFQKHDRTIEIMSRELMGDHASAGESRRIALDEAMTFPGNGVILTTDADAVPNEDWIADNIAAINAGADAVCGRAIMNAADALILPCRLAADDISEKRLLRYLDEIKSLICPDRSDPWPRHQQNSGASIAVRANILRALGGAPHVSTGEDRALIRELELRDARIRHAPHISVCVSGRLEGRAVGGMADTIKRRIHKTDAYLDDTLEPAGDALRRAMACSSLRALRDGRLRVEDLARMLLIDHDTAYFAALSPFFGTAWAEIQMKSPVLQRRKIPHSDLAGETEQACIILKQLKQDNVQFQQHQFQPIRIVYSQAENVL